MTAAPETRGPKATRREYVAVLLMLAAGGGLGLLASRRPWGTAEVPSSFTVEAAEVTGNDLAPLVSAVPLVALAAVLLMPAVRTFGRRIAGGILAALGGVMAVASATVTADLTGRVERWIADAPEHSGRIENLTTEPMWAVLSVTAGAVIVAAGVVIVWHGPRWPSMGARYERPASARSASPRSVSAADPGPARTGNGRRDTPTSAAQTWDALDRGDDPTA
ncbi:Trp biosynthesis-associated membrane protein [Phytoactinopolyspora halotolerans]|uniref:Trp biosynthesis-associated membrane protein n=1 Tax=Phytoactinopolyspora halotolerans TaxID=1981512 RepID=A0A6L9SGE3_9ACTN|nr:Trp biosynthesis-associated membrane protein [Phytoactinopolyspora halotolerans]NEE03160.1 Trp biosynthesis-associated membrane protein [Phytoactinopolyspora halotolerans]